MMFCVGARVILACRSEQRADEARSDIVALTGNENVEVRKLDLASLQSVRDFAQKFNQGKLARGALSKVVIRLFTHLGDPAHKIDIRFLSSSGPAICVCTHLTFYNIRYIQYTLELCDFDKS